MKIDAYAHVLPRASLDRFRGVATGSRTQFLDGLEDIAALHNLDARFRILDQFGDYVQVITPSVPPIEWVAQGQAGIDLSRFLNDELADLVREYPDRFAGFAAALPMDDPDAAVQEAERSVRDLGALGVQLFTNVDGHSLDEPRFELLFNALAQLDRPIWVHGGRAPDQPDFPGESDSRYGLWLSLGWPFEMGLFMARMVASGLFDRHPDLRILTHHGGGMTPMFARRVNGGTLRFNGADHDGERAAFAGLKREPLDYFKMFYADTTVAGSDDVKATLGFFGASHVLFATDMPFGPHGGLGFLRGTIGAIEQLPVSEDERSDLFTRNAERVLGVNVSR